MKQILLSEADVLSGYDTVSQLYPHIPSLVLWRAWEYAAYQRYTLSEPVLDIGCGDGRFFRLIWPQSGEVIGVDMDAYIAEMARQSGVYREVYVIPAHQLPLPGQNFASAYANCSLEHMDHLPQVLKGICQSLFPGGYFLFSAVTDKFLQWASLPLLVDKIGEPQRARTLQAEFEAYHHLVNPLPVQVWIECLEEAGFEVLEHTPILPELTSYLFLFLDHLWHVRRLGGELGDLLYPYLTALPRFPQAFRQILVGVLQMEKDWSIGSGAIFWARRKE